MNGFATILLLFSLLPTPFSNSGITVFLIGDSTMSDKPNPETNPERGWGQMLPLFFGDSVTVKNHAVNGRSTKSFIAEGRWQTVLDLLKAGDYVFIQFGHNDQKNQDSTRFTNPYTGYRRNLERFVNETRAKSAHAVILSSIVRRNFNEFGVLEDTHGPYPFVAREVAQEMNVPFVDLQLLTEDMVLEAGVDGSKELYMWVSPGEYERYPEGKEDNSHLSVLGATEVARRAAMALKAIDIPLAAFIIDGPTRNSHTHK